MAISIPSLVKMTRSPRSFIGGKEESFLLVAKVLDLSATKTILQRNRFLVGRKEVYDRSELPENWGEERRGGGGGWGGIRAREPVHRPGGGTSLQFGWGCATHRWRPLPYAPGQRYFACDSDQALFSFCVVNPFLRKHETKSRATP